MKTDDANRIIIEEVFLRITDILKYYLPIVISLEAWLYGSDKIIGVGRTLTYLVLMLLFYLNELQHDKLRQDEKS